MMYQTVFISRIKLIYKFIGNIAGKHKSRSCLFFNATHKPYFLDCKQGYYGKFCNITCPPGTYGASCAANCPPTCLYDYCHHVYGCLKNITEQTTTVISGNKCFHIFD